MNVYEIMSYTDVNGQNPARRAETIRKSESLKIAKEWSKKYPLVDCVILRYDDYYGEGHPDNNLDGEIGLVCIYTNGKRTA